MSALPISGKPAHYWQVLASVGTVNYDHRQQMIIFPCNICNTPMRVDDSQTGALVRCPTCLATVKVPATAPQREPATVGAAPAAQDRPRPVQRTFTVPAGIRQMRQGGSGKRYGFNCAYCSSRLEANDSMAAQDGQCPTCGNNITIPILDRYGRLIDPKTQQIIKQDPHPVHAYAAAGDRAPGILRQDDGKQQIRCPRCSSMSPITANNCKSCGMPFTMEGTTLEASGASNGFCVAALVLGILGIPAACTYITPILAIVFGIIGFMQVSKGTGEGGKGMAIAGIVCGAIGTFIALTTFGHF